MANSLLPAQGASGLFTLQAPFDSFLLPKVVYTVVAVRSLRELLAAGIDPKVVHYDRHGIPSAKYETDLLNEVSIITLTSSSASWVDVPSSFITGWPAADGVPYGVLSLFCILGALPMDIDLSFLKTKLAETITANLGWTPEIETVLTSDILSKSQDDHADLESARALLITERQTDRAKLLKAESDLLVAREQIQKLSQYIKDNL